MKNLIIVCFIALTVLVQCKRPTDPIGPEYSSPTKEFKLLAPFTVAAATVNLTRDKMSTSAIFSEKVTWNVSYKGLRSSAFKTYRGYSDRIDANNTSFDGKHDGLYFFRAGEDVEASLTFLGSTLIFKDTFRIQTARNWNVADFVSVVLDFESAATSTAYQFYDGPEKRFPAYKQTFAIDPVTGVKSDMIAATNNKRESFVFNFKGDTVIQPVSGSIQGNWFYRLAGQDGIFKDPGAAYFIGGTGFGGSKTFVKETDPSKVYFNIYIYGTGDPGSRLAINFNEDDNGVRGYEEAGQADNYVILEDEYANEVPVDWVGWRLVSFPYSNARITDPGKTARFGNRIQEPHKIKKMGFVLIGNQNSVASVIFDFPVFTVGKPFNPNE